MTATITISRKLFKNYLSVLPAHWLILPSSSASWLPLGLSIEEGGSKDPETYLFFSVAQEEVQIA